MKVYLRRWELTLPFRWVHGSVRFGIAHRSWLLCLIKFEEKRAPAPPEGQ